MDKATSKRTQRPPRRSAKDSAKAYLQELPAKTVVKDAYLEDAKLSSALITLIPGFEYPDWSYKTIGDVLKQLERKQ